MDVVSLREKIERAERDHLELINVISQASTDSEFRKVTLGALGKFTERRVTGFIEQDVIGRFSPEAAAQALIDAIRGEDS
jgi:hypothetical protein